MPQGPARGGGPQVRPGPGRGDPQDQARAAQRPQRIHRGRYQRLRVCPQLRLLPGESAGAEAERRALPRAAQDRGPGQEEHRDQSAGDSQGLRARGGRVCGPGADAGERRAQGGLLRADGAQEEPLLQPAAHQQHRRAGRGAHGGRHRRGERGQGLPRGAQGREPRGPAARRAADRGQLPQEGEQEEPERVRQERAAVKPRRADGRHALLDAALCQVGPGD